MPEPRVGVIGLGNMGSILARRMATAGFDVAGYDVDEEAVQAATADGISPTASCKELVSGTDIVVSSLPNPEIVREVYLGDDGVIRSAERGTLAIETSTIDPGTTRDIVDVADDHGIAVLDAPVSGGLGRARTGTLTVMVGGDEAVFEDTQVQRVLTAFGSDIYYGGETGAGHTLKLLNNMISAATGAVAMEAAALAAQVGVDWEVFMNVVSTSSGSSYMFRKAMPRVLNRNFEATFTLDLGRKDSRLALAMADAVDFPTPMASMMYQLRTEAIAKGLGDEGSHAIVKVFEENAENLVEIPDGIPEDYLSWEDKPADT